MKLRNIIFTFLVAINLVNAKTEPVTIQGSVGTLR